MAALLQCDHITKRVGNFILRDIHFELEPGYILGVIGCNGAGKTTLARVLLGSYKLYTAMDYRSVTRESRGMAANKGDVYIEGHSIKEHTGQYKSKTAYILNESPFAMSLSAKENGIYFGKFYKNFDFERYEKLCGEYQVPYTLPLKKLSKGEQIKMQLAFALSYEAAVYILDEPAGNLDVKFRDSFYDVMRGLVAQGDKSIVYITHLVEELEQLADYVLWIEEGKQKCFGTLEELLDEYLIYSGTRDCLKNDDGYEIVHIVERENHFEALLHSNDCCFPENVKEQSRRAGLKEIMYHVNAERNIS